MGVFSILALKDVSPDGHRAPFLNSWLSVHALLKAVCITSSWRGRLVSLFFMIISHTERWHK